MKNEISVYKETSDNWCGSYKTHKYDTHLVLIYYYPHNDEFVINAEGTDDYSLSKRYKDEKSALTDFMVILGMNDVTIASLKSIGFEFSF